MLPDQPAPSQMLEQRLKPLHWLAAELRLYGLPTLITPDHDLPQLRVALGGTAGAKVGMARRDGQACFVWADNTAAHPLFDPAGAARRITVTLRAERRDRKAWGL